MGQSDYERGQKHGNETKYSHKVGFIDLLGGKDYCKGLEASYKQRNDKAGFFGSTELKDPSSNKSSSGQSKSNKSDTSSTYSSYDSDYSGSSSSSSSIESSYSVVGAIFNVILFSFFLIVGLLIAFFPVCAVVDFIGYTNHWGGGARAVENRASNFLGTIFVVGEFLIILIAVKSAGK